MDRSHVGNRFKNSPPDLHGHFVIASGASKSLVRTTDNLYFESPNVTRNTATIQKHNVPLKFLGNLRFNFFKNFQASISALHEQNHTYDLLSLNEPAKQNITPCFTRNVLELYDGTMLTFIIEYDDFYRLSKEYLISPSNPVQAINKVDSAESTHRYPYHIIHSIFSHANARFIKHSIGNSSVKFLKESDVD
ncbi:hypothetical protein SMKI_12G5050 [Saccharomyces mikatae IFO 1815]|uniref:Uncharacterized protein n=1 Tax=Saccharomyces mikatae IFO 1815 TaxID=226126 RepID=A0AA35IR28_SACMI|nr:uncharacterized protein SMKI_12G5050 [Saccharomyces mikatae IFO 1815]CAI4035352.1 hypothetical protein SMKI_12G5050 [Saccharomyces mikatae IFO 1815]